MTKIAKESPHIQRARRKLKQMVDNENSLITEERLNKATKAMRYWINRHSSERLSLRKKSFRLFDENTSPEDPSHAIDAIRQKIVDEGNMDGKSLRGRIEIRYPLPKTDLENQ